MTGYCAVLLFCLQCVNADDKQMDGRVIVTLKRKLAIWLCSQYFAKVTNQEIKQPFTVTQLIQSIATFRILAVYAWHTHGTVLTRTCYETQLPIYMTNERIRDMPVNRKYDKFYRISIAHMQFFGRIY